MYLQQSCFVCIYSKAVLCDHFQGHIWLEHDIYKTGINFPFQYLLSLSDFRGAACFQDTLNPFLQQLHSLYRIDTMFPGKVQPVYFQDECSLFPLSLQPVSKKDVIYFWEGCSLLGSPFRGRLGSWCTLIHWPWSQRSGHDSLTAFICVALSLVCHIYQWMNQVPSPQWRISNSFCLSLWLCMLTACCHLLVLSSTCIGVYVLLSVSSTFPSSVIFITVLCL